MTEAKRGNQVGTGGVRIGILVFLAHVDAFAPEFPERAGASQQISKDRIQIEHVDASRAGFGGPLEPLDEVLDHFALEWIIEVNDERRARPAEVEDILMDHADGEARAMLPLPLLDVLRG